MYTDKKSVKAHYTKKKFNISKVTKFSYLT